MSGMPNLSVHGGIKPKESSIPKQKNTPRKDLTAEKNKIYIAFLMTDGDSMWVMNTLQYGNWKPEKAELCIFLDGNTGILAYEVTVTEGFVRKFVFIDAMNGELVKTLAGTYKN